MICLPVLHSEGSEACWWQFLLFSQRGLHIEKRLTTRWSRPGQPGVEFGAILVLAGRAAHLEAVRRLQPLHARLDWRQRLPARPDILGGIS